MDWPINFPGREPHPDPLIEAEILLQIALQIARLADEAMEIARAALARVGRPFPALGRNEGGR
jgi:hypothetical protein